MLLFYLSCVACCITAVTVLGENVTVNAGDAAILSCQLVKNKEDLTRITWQRRTKKNPKDTNFFVITPDGEIQIKDELKGRVEFIGSISERNGSIRLNDVKFLDEGVYTCIFSFFPSGPSNKLLNLDVRVPPVVSLTPEVIPVASDTEEIIAACTASNAKPEAHVSWSLGSLNNVLKVQTNVSVNPDGLHTTTSYLTGVASKNLNRQKVECSVKHIALKKDLKQEYSINIHYPPQVVYILYFGGPNKTQQEFGCVGDANPLPSNFTWSRHFPVAETLTSGSSLFVNRTSESNGLYYCVASNQYGSGVASLNVQNLPSDTQGHKAGWILFVLTLLALIVFVGYQFGYLTWQKKQQFFRPARVPTAEPPTSDRETISL
ncbi:nectin-3 isoform X2 [Trichomycterus rosablanca]|uniref:nectin-3 isoform X2 n=1 Tax=Trichomycterus rosablanca TaxID=2290929 RepID=UPI002F35CD81